ncbi:T9SS type A sorting domain-containing protein [Ignavibacterium sp.]|nr:T9SS type A sorting domain-containing protein [Ignavibacterium album]
METGHRLSLQSGVYFYQLRIGNYTETKKMVLIR